MILVFTAAHKVDLASVGVSGGAQDAGRQLQGVRPFAAAGQGEPRTISPLMLMACSALTVSSNGVSPAVTSTSD
jgi:hypothetical protein